MTNNEPQEAPAPRPEPVVKRIIVVGGGRVGRQLARQYPTLAIIESDPAKVERLVTEFPNATIHNGSGSNPDHLREAGVEDADAVVLATRNDETNYKCARVIRRLNPGIRVLARIDDESNTARFTALHVEPIHASLATAASQVTTLLEPERRSLVECVLTDESPVVGNVVGDLDLGSQTNLVSILRREKLIPPASDVKLQAGDVLTLVTMEDKASVLERISGHDGGIDPLSRLYVPLTDPECLQTSFQEAFVLAQRTNATIYAVCGRDQVDLAEEARRLGAMQNVKIHTHLAEGDPMRLLADIVAEQDAKHRDQRRTRGLVFDGVFVRRPERPPWYSLQSRRSTAERLLERIPDHPVVVSAHPKPYRSILVIVDPSRGARVRISYAIDLALTFRSKIVALVTEADEDDEAAATTMIEYLRRTGRVYGVDVEERRVHGNPALETVLEVRHGDHDLVILNHKSQTLSGSFVRRIVRRAPQSVMLVPYASGNGE